MIKYAIENYLNSDCALYASSEFSPYVVENVYNLRPSKPLRFEGIGVAPGEVPEWICAELPYARRPNFTAIFNHNLTTLVNSTDLLMLQACSLGCPPASGFCPWDLYGSSGGPEFNFSLADRIHSDFKNLCSGEFDLGADYRNFRWAFIDSLNTNAFLEIGEVFLGELRSLTNAKLQPGRSDGPEFFEGTKVTTHGQIWSAYYGEADGFKIEIINKNSTSQISELRTFLKEVKRAGGKFVFIPNDLYDYCYYVYLRNMADFGSQIVKGIDQEVYSWKLDLRTLTEGVALLG